MSIPPKPKKPAKAAVKKAAKVAKKKAVKKPTKAAPKPTAEKPPKKAAKKTTAKTTAKTSAKTSAKKTAAKKTAAKNTTATAPTPAGRVKKLRTTRRALLESPPPPDKMLIGALELCNLPELGISGLHVRVDTGATTSSLHVDNIQDFRRDKKRYIRFDIHPDNHDVSRVVACEARVKSMRRVKSSTATEQRRCVILTVLEMGGRRWPIELTLTDRSEMTYLMLLGRQAMAGRILVDPELEYVLGAPPG